MNFYTILESAKRRGETAIGYRIAAEAHDAETAYGVRVNPRKSAEINLAQGDKVIVLSES